MNTSFLRCDVTLIRMIKLLFLILSISLLAIIIFPNEVYAMENSYKKACCEKGKEHHDCCKKKDKNKHHFPEKKDTSKSCNQKSNACLCIAVVSNMSMKNQDVNVNQNLFIALSQKYLLTDDKKPSLVYLDLWLLPKING